MGERTAHVDLTNSSFDDFIRFLFDRDVSVESEGRDYWYWHVEVEFDAKTIGAYYLRLFTQPEFLLARFTNAQLEQGFWAIQGPNLDCSVYRFIEDSDVPYQREKTRSVPWRICLNAFSRRPHSAIPRLRCGGTRSATTGTAGTESESAAAKT